MSAAEPTATVLLAWLFDGPASHLWPMLIVPALAAHVSDRVARLLPPTRADWRIAALLVASPGLAMTGIIGMIFVRALRHTEPGKGLDHFVQYQGSALIAGLLVAFVLLRAALRQRRLARITRLSSAPSDRLLEAAAAAGVVARELPATDCEIFVGGVLRPTVFVSRGALERMDDEQLRAALHHEAAHVEGKDPAFFSLFALLGDLAPISERARTAFVQSRERSADATAALRSGRVALASALIAAVKPARPGLPVPGMNGSGSADWRLRAILGVEQAERNSSDARLKLWSGVALNLLLTAWPAGHIYIAYRLCC